MSASVSPGWFVGVLSALMRRQDLSAERMTEVMGDLLRGACPEAEMAAFLVALHMKGETAEELAAAAVVMRQHCQSLTLGRDDLLDTCGTGGDGSGTFNISTATALVAAAAGACVVKHGNRAISSKSGSADVLAELGVRVAAEPAVARTCLERVGMAFLLAPLYHPALRHVGEVRRRLGVRTLFNCLGPLANPAGARRQLLGVGQPEWLDRMAGAMARLGAECALLLHARDGLDEVSLGAPTMVRQVRGHEVTALEWQPEDFGLGRVQLAEIQVSGPSQSAALIGSVLRGEDGPALRVVLANAAAALLAAGRVADLREGVEVARRAVRDGKALAVLDALKQFTESPP